MPDKSDKAIDVTGVCCPVPLIELAKATKQLHPGQSLQVTGNDPIFETAVRDFCQTNGHQINEIKILDNNSVQVILTIGTGG